MVKIANTIYEALEKRRGPDNEGNYKPVSMNEFIERILWAYAQGEFVRKGQSGDVKVVRAVKVHAVAPGEPKKADHKPLRSA